MATRPDLARAGLALCRLSLIVIALAAVPVEAQLLYGGLVGTVNDANGAVVPGARVTIVNTETNLTREATTDAQGAYSFVNVLAGPYDVKVALEGFREAVRSRVPVTVGQINQFRGPGGWNHDLSVFRSFHLGATRRIEARVEASNITDTPKFANPTGNLQSGDFMRIFGLYNAYAERQVRLAVRYSF